MRPIKKKTKINGKHKSKYINNNIKYERIKQYNQNVEVKRLLKKKTIFYYMMSTRNGI